MAQYFDEIEIGYAALESSSTPKEKPSKNMGRFTHQIEEGVDRVFLNGEEIDRVYDQSHVNPDTIHREVYTGLYIAISTSAQHVLASIDGINWRVACNIGGCGMGGCHNIPGCGSSGGCSGDCSDDCGDCSCEGNCDNCDDKKQKSQATTGGVCRKCGMHDEYAERDVDGKVICWKCCG